tara:strand:- start:116 stop:391 length:276 start_codon:yes stop_codon:yes gene_type:complete
MTHGTVKKDDRGSSGETAIPCALGPLSPRRTQIEHPLKHDVMIKVQTTKRSTPATAVEHACERLAGEYRAMARSFQFALERAGEAGGMEER